LLEPENRGTGNTMPDNAFIESLNGKFEPNA
jgi:hypothetical protein